MANRSPCSLECHVQVTSQDAQSQEPTLAADIPKSSFAGTIPCSGDAQSQLW